VWFVLPTLAAIASAASPPPAAHAVLLGVATQLSPDTPRLDVQADLDALALALDARGFGAIVRHDTTSDPIAVLDTLTLRSGDTVFVHVSGHGTRLPDDNGDEPDGFDEALRLPDGSVLRDDHWGSALSRLARALGPDGLLVVSHDTCYGGGLTRGLASRSRGDGPTPDHADGLRADLTGARVVHLAAARPTETARETAAGGAYSAALARALIEGAPDWIAVHQRIQAELARTAPGQHPLLHGPGHHAVHPGALPIPGLPISGQLPDGRLQVAGGRLLGFEVGASVRLEGTDTTARVSEVTDSLALLETTAPLVSLDHLRVLPPTGALPEVVLHIDLPATSAWHRALDAIATAGSPLAAEFQVTTRAGQVVLRQGKRVVATAPLNQPPEQSTVLATLRAERARRHLAALHLPGSGAPELTLHLADPTTCAPLAPVVPGPDGELLLAPGTTVTVAASHTSTAQRAVQLIHIDADNTVSILADAGADRLPPEHTWTVPGCWRTVPPFGTERIIALTTRQAVPLAPWLSGDATRATPDWTHDGRTTTLTYTVSPIARDRLVNR